MTTIQEKTAILTCKDGDAIALCPHCKGIISAENPLLPGDSDIDKLDADNNIVGVIMGDNRPKCPHCRERITEDSYLDMELDIYGNADTGFSAHGCSLNSDLEPCPFCGSANIEVSNTHTPSYQGECQDCGATGPSNAYPENDVAKNEQECVQIHQKAFEEAVRLWNKRESTHNNHAHLP